MIDLPDVNVLVAILHEGHEFHDAAAAWFDTQPRFAMTPITEIGTVRTLMRPDIVGRRIDGPTALDLVGDISAQATTFIPNACALSDARFAYALVGPRQVTDLHLLEVAARNDARLVTFDHTIAAALRPQDRRWLSEIM